MQVEIRAIKPTDKPQIKAMMHDFYSSDAVFTNGSDEIFEADLEACLSQSPFLSGFCFTVDGTVAGYAMTAHSFSTEFGKPCVWIEDIYIKPEYRGMGIGTEFFSLLFERHPNSLFRLEAEHENASALELYRRLGFDTLPYIELKR